jgi:hypothetical protein
VAAADDSTSLAHVDGLDVGIDLLALQDLIPEPPLTVLIMLEAFFVIVPRLSFPALDNAMSNFFHGKTVSWCLGSAAYTK